VPAVISAHRIDSGYLEGRLHRNGGILFLRLVLLAFLVMLWSGEKATHGRWRVALTSVSEFAIRLDRVGVEGHTLITRTL
jgi:hypothetical protein